MGRDIVLKLSVEVIVANTFDVKISFGTINLDVEWEVLLVHCISFLFVLHESGVGHLPCEFFLVSFIANLLLSLEQLQFD